MSSPAHEASPGSAPADTKARAQATRQPTGPPRATKLRRGVLVRRLLIAADVLGFGLAYAALLVVAGGRGDADELGAGRELVLLAAGLPIWIVLASARGLYHRDEERPDHTTVAELFGVTLLITFVVWVVLMTASLTGVASPDTERWAIFWLLAVGAVILARSVVRVVARRLPGYEQRTLVVGAGPAGQLVARKLVQHAEYGTDVVGFVEDEPQELRRDVQHIPVVGRSEHLLDIVETDDIDRVVIAFTRESPAGLEELVGELQARGVQVNIVPQLFSALGPNVEITSIEGIQLVSVPPTRMGTPALAAKRAVDVVGAGVALVLLSPVFAVVALLVKRGSAGPVFFRQTRLGLDQRPFTFLKFRTMHADTSSGPHREYIRRVSSEDALPEGHGLYKLEQPSAVTGVGRWLRKTSLDELPQLLNVLRGDMSLVGPRPCIPYELEHFEPRHYERFSVPAGITGLWQVKARAHASFAEALDMDVAYARSWSFGLDLRLLLETPLYVLRRTATR